LLISDEEKERWGESFDDGSEAYVYNAPDDNSKVIKIIEYLAQNKSLPEFFERTIGYNTLFPDTSYDIVGFIEDSVRENLYDRKRMLKPVLKQPYVYGKILAGPALRFNYFRRILVGGFLGFI
jgi:predicted RNA methylase